MKTLYFDCFAGASGNMILGALIAIGLKPVELIDQIKLLDMPEFDIKFKKVKKSGISATLAEVSFESEEKYRYLNDIKKLIKKSKLSKNVKKRSIEIFTNLAKAEATVHGISIKKVHFHEIGAMDTIVDVVGACIGFEMLEIEKFVCSKIHTGSGFVEIEHGKFPVPPPAVSELLNGIPIYSTEIEGELITPTGAAIIATVCDEFGKIPEMKVKKTAYGAGSRDYENFPNTLRLMLGESVSVDDSISEKTNETEEKKEKNKQSAESQNLLLIETNIDDLSPQIIGFVMERAFELGALDCWFTSIQMKKNRPATMVSILCEKDKQKTLTALLYKETSTLGVRIKEVSRECLPRKIIEVETTFGKVEVKVAEFEGEIVNIKPEYEQIRQIALASNISIKDVENEVVRKLKLDKGEE